MNLLKGSWLLKLAALVVALITYFYIHNEIYNVEKNNITDPSYKLIKLTAKNLPVKTRLESTPPDGYRIIEDRVTVSPAQVVVIGPEALLENAWNAETAIVDISENTKTISKKIPIESVAGIHVVGQPYNVEVSVPIEKIPEKQPAFMTETPE
jgi:YbbR domain-containing protein